MTENLPFLTPDAARGERTMARCHGMLAARRSAAEVTARAPRPRPVAVERLLLAGVCIVYLVSMAANVLLEIAPR